MSKIRNACFTVNNYTEEMKLKIISYLNDNTTYYVFGHEVGENGTPHLQGYCEFANSRSFKAVHKALCNAHIEARKGTAQQASEYCKKDGNFEEHGEISVQGARTDIDQVRDILRESTGRPMREVVDNATSYQSIKVAEQWLKYHEIKRLWKPEVRWYYGATGTGKSRTAHEEMPEAYVWTTPKWWDGYDAHEDVIIDDFRKNMCTFSELLKILDRYSYSIETKGGTRSLLARRITITCPFHPADVYATREDCQQLIRRCDTIKCFDDEKLH